MLHYEFQKVIHGLLNKRMSNIQLQRKYVLLKGLFTYIMHLLCREFSK